MYIGYSSRQVRRKAAVLIHGGPSMHGSSSFSSGVPENDNLGQDPPTPNPIFRPLAPDKAGMRCQRDVSLIRIIEYRCSGKFCLHFRFRFHSQRI